MKKSGLSTPVFVALFGICLAGAGLAQESDQVTATVLANATGKSAVITPHAHLNGQAHARFGIPNIDSLVNFNGHYLADGFDPNGNPNTHWYYNTVGQPAADGRNDDHQCPGRAGLSRFA
jgi:hypothetical protein